MTVLLFCPQASSHFCFIYCQIIQASPEKVDLRSRLDLRRKEREISASTDSESLPDKSGYLLNGSYVFQKVLKVSPVYEEIIVKKKKKSPKKSKRSRSNSESDSQSDSQKDDLRLRLDARRRKRKLSANKNIKVQLEMGPLEIEEEPEKKPKVLKEDDNAG